jgi:transposase-like protein
MNAEPDDVLDDVPDTSDSEETDSPEILACDLNDRQRLAVSLVLAGHTDADVAAAVGAHRVTVTRWRLAHPAFRSALSAGRQSAHRAAEQARRLLYRKALDRLMRELDDDGPQAVRVAMALVAHPPDDPGPVESVDDVCGSVAYAWMRKFQNPMRWQPIPGASCYSIAANLVNHIECWEQDHERPAPDNEQAAPDADAT